MNRRNKLKRRERQRQENMPLLRICRQCDQPFSPTWLSGLKQWTHVCDTCGLRNIAKACGLEQLLPNFMNPPARKLPATMPAELKQKVAAILGVQR